MIWYLIDSLDVGACLLVVVLGHLLAVGLVVLRTYSAALRNQTPMRSGPVTMVVNGVSETQWRDGWSRQLGLWAGVFSVGPAVLYVLLGWLALSRWMPGHGWVVPVVVVGAVCLTVVGGFVWWRGRQDRTQRPAEVPVASFDPIPHAGTGQAVSEPYSAPYGSWGQEEGL